MAEKYSAETKLVIIQTVFAVMADGNSARQACLEAGVPVQTFMDWVAADKALAGQYAQARDLAIEKMADEIQEISDAPVPTLDNGGTDTGAVQKQRLQVDTRKWLLSKMAPKKYGDKLEIDAVVTELPADQRQARLAYLMGKVKVDGSGEAE